MTVAVRNVRLPRGSRGEKPTPVADVYAIEEPVMRLWSRLLNVARYECGMRDPSLSRMLEYVCTKVLVDGYRNEIDPAIAERFARYDVDVFEQIESGELVCIEWRLFPEERTLRCGGWNINDMEFNHVIRKSKGGHKGPVVPLCHYHHDRVTRNVGGDWRFYAKRWGFGPEVYDAK